MGPWIGLGAGDERDLRLAVRHHPIGAATAAVPPKMSSWHWCPTSPVFGSGRWRSGLIAPVVGVDRGASGFHDYQRDPAPSAIDCTRSKTVAANPRPTAQLPNSPGVGASPRRHLRCNSRHRNVRFWGQSGPRFRATEGPLVAKPGHSAAGRVHSGPNAHKHQEFGVSAVS